MSRLFWQLPWGGPSRLYADKPIWSVMPSPGMGDAKAICVPVAAANGTLKLALPQAAAPLLLTAAPMGAWTPLKGDMTGSPVGFLCLVGYDQPEAGGGGVFIQSSGTHVNPAELEDALARLQIAEGRGGSLLDHVLPAAGPLDELPSPVGSDAATGKSAAASRAAGAALSTASSPASVTLAFASCQYPSGFMDGVPAQASLQRLADLLKSPQKRQPERLLMLGDQVYADATAGLLDPVRLDDRYRVPYEELVHMKPLREIMRRIPVSCMLDDHEIANDWEPYVQGAQGSLYRKGLAAYWTYQRGMPAQDRTWIRLGGSDWSLFIADTRTHRDARSVKTLKRAEILGTVQRDDLEKWLLSRPAGHLKLIASPAMLLPRPVEHVDEPLHIDGWAGYPASLDRLLQLICDKELRNVIFLSGDAHLGCDVQVTLTGPQGRQTTTRSVHTPALYAPMPFANERPWNLKIPDTFQFGPQGSYTCDVHGTVTRPPRDGFSLLKADRSAGTWTVTVEVI